MEHQKPMASEYMLEQRIIGPRRQMPITEQEFLALKEARSVLSEALEFEQRYELLVGNFVEMELSLTELCLRSTVQPQFAYADVATVIQESNRQIANLLSAARSYIDQVKQDFKSLPLTTTFADSASALLSEQYDGSLEYRFMEALRNYTQHRAFPATKFSGALVPEHDASGWAECLTISARKDELFQDKKFKQKFLEALPEEVDLRHYSREYVRGLGRVHVALRRLVRAAVAESRALVDATLETYGDAGKYPTIGLGARRLGDHAEDVPVLTDWDDVRAKLENKNSHPPDLWPRSRGREPSGTDLRVLREQAGHNVNQAARLVFLPPGRWEQYEAGLRVPESVHALYMLQIDRHPTHVVIPRVKLADKAGAQPPQESNGP